MDAGISVRGTIDTVEERGVRRADDAFADVFAAERDGALRLAYVLVGDRELAQDVVADAFAAMYPKWKAGKVDDAAAYLRRAVVNQVRGRFRRNATRRRYEAHRRSGPEQVGSDAGVADRDLVRAALAELPIGQRAAVALRYLDDRSEAETAQALGVSLGTVKSQTARGLERLRAALGDMDGDA